MALFNYATRELSAKIVYYGPGLSGKTTNIEMVHQMLRPEQKGRLISLPTETDRTLCFDFLPLDLGEIIVEGRPMMADRKLREFFQRRATGRGSYLAPWEIAEIPASRVTDILRTMRGVLVSPDRFGSRVSVTRGCQDEPTVFLDGIEIRDPDINGLLQPGDVNAIEVYNNAAQIPPQYERGTSGCGVILFWTR